MKWMHANISETEIEDLMSLARQITVFCDKKPRSLVDRYQRFGESCCLHHQGRTVSSTLMMEALGSSVKR
jgi:hypothetical protein